MRILCFGDSNTHGYDPRAYFGGRYPAQYRWTDILAGMTGCQVLNAGVNGREIPGCAEEVYGLDDTIDYLLVMLGTNDLLQRNSVSAVVSRMESFLTQLPIGKERILLIAPPVMKLGAWVGEEHLISDSAKLGKEYQLLAKRLGIWFADARNWKIDLAFDGVHFSESGHAAFAERLYQTMQNLNML